MSAGQGDNRPRIEICHVGPLHALWVHRAENRKQIKPILTCDWLDTGGASLGEQLSEALGTVRLLVAAGEALPGQGHLTVGAGEALAVPRFVLVGHTAAGDDLLGEMGSVLF